jgi:hypothetical protein
MRSSDRPRIPPPSGGMCEVEVRQEGGGEDIPRDSSLSPSSCWGSDILFSDSELRLIATVSRL